MTRSRQHGRRLRAGARGERGVVLILAIFAVVLLSVLAVGISSAVRVELRASHSSLERMQGLFLAEAGIRQARAILLYDDRKLDTLQDGWGPEAFQPLDLPHEFGAGFCRVRVDDACGRININKAGLDTLFRLTGDLQVAQAIMAWRQLIAGEDDTYYESLLQPYAPRHGPFQTVGELLLVRGVTPDMFFGTDGKPGLSDLCTVEGISENTDANGSLRIGLNEFRNWGEFEAFQNSMMAKLGAVLTMYDATEIFNGWSRLTSSGLPGYSSLTQLATVAGLSYDKIVKVIDYLTVEPGISVAGLVNVNTARPEVIAALPGGSLALGAAIEARRRQVPFASLGEFTEFLLGQPNGLDVFAAIIDHVNLKSSSFIVESMGYPPTKRGFRTLRALVRRGANDVEVIQQSEEDWPLPPPVEQAALSAGR
jgi:type II secretory pathway component PulK